MNLIDNIKNVINDRGLKKSVIAQKAGISAVTLSHILNEKRPITMKAFVAICGAIDISPDEVLKYKIKTG